MYVLQVVLTNVPEQHATTVSGATQPGRPENAPYPLPFSRVVYIEATDFRLQDSKDYYGLALGKSAMLRWVFLGGCFFGGSGHVTLLTHIW